MGSAGLDACIAGRFDTAGPPSRDNNALWRSEVVVVEAEEAGAGDPSVKDITGVTGAEDAI